MRLQDAVSLYEEFEEEAREIVRDGLTMRTYPYVNSSPIAQRILLRAVLRRVRTLCIGGHCKWPM